MIYKVVYNAHEGVLNEQFRSTEVNTYRNVVYTNANVVDIQGMLEYEHRELNELAIEILEIKSIKGGILIKE